MSIRSRLRDEEDLASASRWKTVGFEVSALGLVLTFGALCPVGLLLSAIGLKRSPRGWAIAGVLIGALGTTWFVMTLLNERPMRFDSGEFGTIRPRGELDGRGLSEGFAVEIRGSTADTAACLFVADERAAFASVPIAVLPAEGVWWLGPAFRPLGIRTTDRSGVASFDFSNVEWKSRYAGKELRFQGAVLEAGERRWPEWELTDAIKLRVGARSP